MPTRQRRATGERRAPSSRTSALDRLLRHWLVPGSVRASGSARVRRPATWLRSGSGGPVFRPCPGELKKGCPTASGIRPRSRKRESGPEARRRSPATVRRRPLARCRSSERQRVGSRRPRRGFRSARASARVADHRDGSPLARRPKGWCVGPAAHGRCPVRHGAVSNVVSRRSSHPRRTSSEVRRRHPRCGRSDAIASCEGPRRGTKPMEGQGVSRLATVAERPDSTAEQSLEVDAGSRGARRGVLVTVRSSGSSGGLVNGKGATATVTWRGCWRGFLRGV